MSYTLQKCGDGVDLHSLMWYCVYKRHLFWFTNIGWFINQSAKHFFLINIVRNANTTWGRLIHGLPLRKNFVIKNRSGIDRRIDPSLSFSNASPFHLSPPLVFLRLYSPKPRLATSKASFSPRKVNYNQLQTMSPPCVHRELGTGRRLLWAF